MKKALLDRWLKMFGGARHSYRLNIRHSTAPVIQRSAFDVHRSIFPVFSVATKCSPSLPRSGGAGRGEEALTALTRDIHHSTFPILSRLAVTLLLIGLATGCSTVSKSLPPSVQDFGASYKPSNVYRRNNVLPLEVRRVALLPLTTTGGTAPFLDDGVMTLEPLIYPELEKTRRFEVIPVTAEQMKAWTGQPGWRTDEPLPPDFFAKISQATGCDAVIFCQLTRYQPYQPLAVGWKFSLVQNSKDTATPPAMQARILWSVDEVLDSGETTVATGARNYYTEHLRNDAASSDAGTVLSSPLRFGQYTLFALFGTLPPRPPAAGIYN